AVPIAKKTSRAHPRISLTTPPVEGRGSGRLSVSIAETCWISGSVVIRMLLVGPSPIKWNCYFSQIAPSFPELEFFRQAENHATHGAPYDPPQPFQQHPSGRSRFEFACQAEPVLATRFPDSGFCEDSSSRSIRSTD